MSFAITASRLARLVAGLSLILPLAAAQDSVLISEFVARNATGLADEGGDYIFVPQLMLLQ